MLKREPMTVNVLGTDYAIICRKYSDDEYFKRANCGGYCACMKKQIVICDMSTFPDWEHEDKESVESQEKLLLRHEIVHAFLEESGLSTNSDSIDAWARDEEIVDWIAIQGPKIYAAWEKVGSV